MKLKKRTKRLLMVKDLGLSAYEELDDPTDPCWFEVWTEPASSVLSILAGTMSIASKASDENDSAGLTNSDALAYYDALSKCLLDTNLEVDLEDGDATKIMSAYSHEDLPLGFMTSISAAVVVYYMDTLSIFKKKLQNTDERSSSGKENLETTK